MKRFWCILVIASLISAGTATAQFYRYVDKQGIVKYTDDINQVPENQRTQIRSYAESQPAVAGVKESSEKAEKNTSDRITSPEPSGTAANAGESGNGESLEAVKTRLEDTKKQLDGEYQALVKEKEVLAKEKDKLKSRDQVNNYNKRVESFNQRAGKYETESNSLRAQVEAYNARVMEDNDKLLKK